MVIVAPRGGSGTPMWLAIALVIACSFFINSPVVFAQDEMLAPIPELEGPKRTIAVGNFDAVGTFIDEYGDWDIGGGLAAMLTTALINSDRFIVVERAQLAEVLSEQGLAMDGLTTAETGARVGQLTGAQLFVYGAVTEFEQATSRGGFSIGLSGGSSLPFNLGGATEKATGHVGMDIRIVDSTTGQIMESHHVGAELESTGLSLSGGVSGISLGSDQFNETPLGEATRQAINDAVIAIVETARQKAWTGQVVDYDGEYVFINAGELSGVMVGDQFMVERVGRVMTDPSTGEVLFVQRDPIGLMILVQVLDRISLGSFAPIGDLLPERGDSVAVVN